MFVAERYLSGLVKVYGKHPVSTEMEVLGTQMACQFLKLDHHIQSSLEKSLIEIERKIQYIKDRTECFDDYFPCKLKNCKLKHVRNWLNLFIAYHNKELKPVNEQSRMYVYVYIYGSSQFTPSHFTPSDQSFE